MFEYETKVRPILVSQLLINALTLGIALSLSYFPRIISSLKNLKNLRVAKLTRGKTPIAPKTEILGGRADLAGKNAISDLVEQVKVNPELLKGKALEVVPVDISRIKLNPKFTGTIGKAPKTEILGSKVDLTGRNAVPNLVRQVKPNNWDDIMGLNKDWGDIMGKNLPSSPGVLSPTKTVGTGGGLTVTPVKTSPTNFVPSTTNVQIASGVWNMPTAVVSTPQVFSDLSQLATMSKYRAIVSIPQIGDFLINPGTKTVEEWKHPEKLIEEHKEKELFIITITKKDGSQLQYHVWVTKGEKGLSNLYILVKHLEFMGSVSINGKNYDEFKQAVARKDQGAPPYNVVASGSGGTGTSGSADQIDVLIEAFREILDPEDIVFLEKLKEDNLKNLSEAELNEIINRFQAPDHDLKGYINIVDLQRVHRVHRMKAANISAEAEALIDQSVKFGGEFDKVFEEVRFLDKDVIVDAGDKNLLKDYYGIRYKNRFSDHERKFDIDFIKKDYNFVKEDLVGLRENTFLRIKHKENISKYTKNIYNKTLLENDSFFEKIINTPKNSVFPKRYAAEVQQRIADVLNAPGEKVPSSQKEILERIMTGLDEGTLNLENEIGNKKRHSMKIKEGTYYEIRLTGGGNARIYYVSISQTITKADQTQEAVQKIYYIFGEFKTGAGAQGNKSAKQHLIDSRAKEIFDHADKKTLDELLK
jgi:hypothetical protein